MVVTQTPRVGVTIRDVARAAGVSTATVSRALRGLPNVDDATRAKVQAIAHELDYVVSPNASRLASGRNCTVALLTPFVSRWYFRTVLSGVEPALRKAGLDLLVLVVDEAGTDDPAVLLNRLRRRVDGVLVISLSPDGSPIAQVVDLGLPTSLIGVTHPGVRSIHIDDVQAGAIATQHLLNLGHRQIGVISGQAPASTFLAERDRLAGFRATMAAAGLPVDPALVAAGSFTVAGGEQAMTGLLTARQRPSAVFALSDEMAFGALRALDRHGLRAGHDVSIIGIDDHDMSEYLGLTTVAQPVAELGELAAQSLIAQLDGGAASTETALLPTTLVVRTSTGPTPAAGQR